MRAAWTFAQIGALIAALGCGCRGPAPASGHVPLASASGRSSAAPGPQRDLARRDLVRAERLRREVLALCARAEGRAGRPGEELEALSLLIQARGPAAEHARLRRRLLAEGAAAAQVPALGEGEEERLVARARGLARRLRVVFALFVEADGRTEDSREYSGRFVRALADLADLRATLPPGELLDPERLTAASPGGRWERRSELGSERRAELGSERRAELGAELGAAPGGIDYLIVARVRAERVSEAQGVHFFRARGSVSIQHVPSGRSLLQAGFPSHEGTKVGDPQRRRAAVRSAEAGAGRLADLLVDGITRLGSL